MIKHQRYDQTGKDIEVEKPELEKRYQEIIDNIIKKPPPQKKPAAKAESEDAKSTKGESSSSRSKL